ncbi:bifunctional [glutamine synthetase] adenylyltransferase/[glutamine synthetase]-adenylyl-L-tyrosine phosphorylase [Pseudovibrio sp. Tun.PSC04-5.I4]|uniref:bifunctional [glutamine synthetase] adenylyltransferase/[glutamine synthetase]-adenylyl-L-tyrosine phosphorylase n=1 Tax=Pseudovibrio sp. Tun.PSC04-5.I4 TaxID=1798213 RepID=UPI00087F94EA|nr:bifunctional [glutamine synthetase] adenylyltransferase/[glutamine synthetase]-adenylyl-L-tyrosine phosphorylase [Pseudovibrio sp. Tun.PSC04-5.I4]SDQ89572.1 glutamate-ammonia-ligase adenylyltransferase [Pseudovibrio sp. Tun.PSC04-5.I4]
MGQGSEEERHQLKTSTLKRVHREGAPAPLLERLEKMPVCADDDLGNQHLKDLIKKLERKDLISEFEQLCQRVPHLRSFIKGFMVNAPFLRETMLRDVHRFLRILNTPPEETIAILLQDCLIAKPQTEAELMQVLRLAKQEMALTVALTDIAGAWPLESVTGALTRFADTSLTACLRFCFRDLEAKGKFIPVDHDEPEKEAGYFILAMGKHGAGELNYSSDIDLIIIYDPERSRLIGGAEAPVEFVRMTRRLVKLMNERTGDGYVFRTDLRLRPDPGATPLAISVPAALVYYESLGQNWERAALIKARPCAGDIEAGEIFLEEIRPFVWRKYLDYAAISDVHSIKRQIHAHKGFGKITVAGHNVKLGRGGIREVEFFAQTQQLIAGGRNPQLRDRRTIITLERLADCGWIDQSAYVEMEEAYRYLREVEHRIQMINDEQTHILPKDEEALTRVYHLMGIRGRSEFATEIRARFETVQKHYSGLFEHEPDLATNLGNLVFTGDDEDPDTVETLMQLGFHRPIEAIKIIRQWHYGRYPAVRAPKSRERLTEFTPILLDALAKTENADKALLTFDSFLSKLPMGVQLFGLLKSNPHLLNLLAMVMGNAPRMAEIVSRRVHVLDALLEPAFFGGAPTPEQVNAALATTLGQASYYEEALDRARIFAQEQQFLLGLRLITSSISAAEMGQGLSTLADAVLCQLLPLVQKELEETHGKISGADVALVAMGKLGGQEITCSSDLDLILLYDFPEDVVQSDGKRPLAPSQYYSRLTQRLVSALTAPTAEGVLYEVDFRLRPSGNSGPLATRFASFKDYQSKDAWTWEHMALTRTRVITSSSVEFSMQIDCAVSQLLQEKREQKTLALEVCDMRARIQKEKPAKSPWQIKGIPGGLIDIEFIAQFLQLAHGVKHPEILQTRTEDALIKARDLGVLSEEDAETLLPALRHYEDLTQILKLALTGHFDPKTAPGGLLDMLVDTGGEPDFERLTIYMQDQQAKVRETFERLLGKVEQIAKAP